MTTASVNGAAPPAAQRQPRRHLAGAVWPDPAWPRAARRRRPRPESRSPGLRLTPYAWAKLLFLRDAGPIEVGGFGVAAADDPLLIEDLVLIEQRCTSITVEFDDEAVADFFDRQIDLGRRPESFARLWIHTHPGNSAEPSSTDEETFERCFGRTDWAVMFILARAGQCYSRLRFNCGPGGELHLPVAIDWEAPFPAADHPAWAAEYNENVDTTPPAFEWDLSESEINRTAEDELFR